ncbi:MAG TPA: hypothetical protein VGW34_08800 [Allosphingosinicella sp.]|nr:hypothetical protein [Allosphingosinicella sp.]
MAEANSRSNDFRRRLSRSYYAAGTLFLTGEGLIAFAVMDFYRCKAGLMLLMIAPTALLFGLAALISQGAKLREVARSILDAAGLVTLILLAAVFMAAMPASSVFASLDLMQRYGLVSGLLNLAALAATGGLLLGLANRASAPTASG